MLWKAIKLNTLHALLYWKGTLMRTVEASDLDGLFKRLFLPDFLFKKRFILFYVYQCSVCMCTCVPEEGTRSHYRWLRATMWLIGIELRTSGRAVLLTAEPYFQPKNPLYTVDWGTNSEMNFNWSVTVHLPFALVQVSQPAVKLNWLVSMSLDISHSPPPTTRFQQTI